MVWLTFLVFKAAASKVNDFKATFCWMPQENVLVTIKMRYTDIHELIGLTSGFKSQ